MDAWSEKRREQFGCLAEKANSMHQWKEAAQRALDELWVEHRIPFRLIAHEVNEISVNDFLIEFYDSRLLSVKVHLIPGRSFEECVSKAVLEKLTVHLIPPDALRKNPTD